MYVFAINLNSNTASSKYYRILGFKYIASYFLYFTFKIAHFQGEVAFICLGFFSDFLLCKSKTQVMSCELRVQIYELRVQINELRV